jgi:uncharacterized membrane protein
MGSRSLEANIASMIKARRKDEAQTPSSVKFADRATRFIGSLTFLVVQTIVTGTWIAWNTVGAHALGSEPFDPYPFQALTLALSVEAIYLTALVLIAQNRMSEVAERRAEVDLQINLLDEKETTHILQIVDAIAMKVGADVKRTPELEDLKREVTPEDVLARVEEEERQVR